jgi:hypothetical protein
MGINPVANRGNLLVEQGRFAEGLTELDRSIRASARWGSDVNLNALRAMHLLRACALSELGRGATEISSTAAVQESGRPLLVAKLALCHDDIGAARAALIGGLSDKARRGDIIEALQPSEHAPFPSAYSRTMLERWNRLRADPALLAALAPYGRILPEPVNAAAPPEPPAP